MSSHCHFGDKLNKMDNAGYDRDGERRSTVELGAVILQQESQVIMSPTTTLNGNGHGLMGCSDHCLKLHQQHEKAGEKAPAESPWHHLKTIFLVGTILFLAIWILVYTLLSQLNML